MEYLLINPADSEDLERLRRQQNPEKYDISRRPSLEIPLPRTPDLIYNSFHTPEKKPPQERGTVIIEYTN